MELLFERASHRHPFAIGCSHQNLALLVRRRWRLIEYERFDILSHVLLHVLRSPLARGQVQKLLETTDSFVKRHMHSEPLEPVREHIGEVPSRQSKAGIERSMLDLLPCSAGIHPPIDQNFGKNREISTLPLPFQSLKRYAIPLDMKTFVPITLGHNTCPEHRQTDGQKPQEQPTFDSIDPFTGGDDRQPACHDGAHDFPIVERSENAVALPGPVGWEAVGRAPFRHSAASLPLRGRTAPHRRQSRGRTTRTYPSQSPGCP